MTNIQGKCHCGENTFSVQLKPEYQFICYCNSCRALNSSGHLCGIMLDESNLSRSEKTKTYAYEGGSGNSIILHFCPVCATHLYAYPTAYEGKVVIRANTLNEVHFCSQQSLFIESAFPWDNPK
ncbi:GFA family protein [Thiotrichales bacterium 19S3-7]|nr:GFA family protein [Thiotrichales bacterium 19S3-7]MCF6802584.1 GFA family protein [Thiotrichales bacterium 19S3-11]